MQASAQLLMQQLAAHYTPLQDSLKTSVLCILHPACCSMQTLARKCFSHINLGHCQLHLSHPTQCFNLSHLNIFSGRMHAG